MKLRVAHRVACSEAEGPHRRYALWVQGCTLACPGCCNPELFAAEGGLEVSVAALAEELDVARRTHGIEGLTVLGGEPLEQLAAVTGLCAAAQHQGLGVLLFSGHTLAEIESRVGGDVLLASVDTLVDGRFMADRRDTERRFIGSTNQRVSHRSARYAEPGLWRGAGGVELQWTADGRLSVHGEPGLARRLVRALGAPGVRGAS